jgi:tRNA U38,U39,U40 pseudouridine synthase TruA
VFVPPELLGGKLLDDLHVDPALVRIIAEQVALDPAARTDIGIAATNRAFASVAFTVPLRSARRTLSGLSP